MRVVLRSPHLSQPQQGQCCTEFKEPRGRDKPIYCCRPQNSLCRIFCRTQPNHAVPFRHGTLPSCSSLLISSHSDIIDQSKNNVLINLYRHRQYFAVTHLRRWSIYFLPKSQDRCGKITFYHNNLLKKKYKYRYFYCLPMNYIRLCLCCPNLTELGL